jgi:hypothetical protein
MALERAVAKIDWASEHLQHLGEHLTSYIKTNPYEFVPDPNSRFEKNGEQWVSGTFGAREETILSVLALQAGDVISNLRSSLDYLVWELVLANKGTPTTTNAFPICDTVNSFGSELQKGRLSGTKPAVVSLVESMQPYHTGQKCHETFFWVLHHLSNINKHRRILDVYIRSVIPPSDFEIETSSEGVAYARINPPLGLLKPGTKLGPYRIIEGKVDVDRNLMAYVAFQETPVDGWEVLSFLDKMRDYVRQQVLKFESFFV